MKTITTRLFKALFYYDWEVVEIQGALFKVLWGFWLLLPFQTFRTIQGYNQIGSENVWGWGLLILGSLHLFGILSHIHVMRRWLAFVAFVFWIFTIILIARQVPTAGILPMFCVIAFFMGINFLRLGVHIEEVRKTNLGPPPHTKERRNDRTKQH